MKMESIQLLPKIIYFLIYFLFGTYEPFLNAFLISIGFSATKAGFTLGIKNLFCLVGMLLNILADYTGYRKVIMTLELFGISLFYIPLPFVSKYLCDQNNNSTNATSVSLMKNVQNDNCVDEIHLTIMLMIFGAAIFEFGLSAFSDAVVVQCVKEHENVGSFGQQRLFASLSFAITSLTTPLMIEKIKIKYFPEYGLPFSTILLIAIVTYPIMFTLINKLKYRDENQIVRKYSLKKVFGIVVKNFRIAMFFVVVLINGIGMTLFGMFLYVFLTDELKVRGSIAGMGGFVQCFSEMLMFIFSSSLMKLFHGPKNCLIIGCICYIIRFVVMAYSNSMVLILSVQALHAFSFALYYESVIEIVRAFTPVEGLTTMLTLLKILQSSFSSLLGTMVGGYLYDKYGGRRLFLYASFLFGGLLIYLVCQTLYDYLQPQQLDEQGIESINDDNDPLLNPVNS